jgi:Transglutaminase-like superfamily
MPPPARRRSLEAAVEVTVASLELRLLPRERTVSRLGAIATETAGRPPGEDEVREARLVGRDVARAGRRLPWHPTCLRQAIAVQRMLRRRGIDARLHLGVTSIAVGEAHAWVTVGEQTVVGNRGVERFVPLASFG